MEEMNHQEVDMEKIGCRVVDVHVALQHAFSEFANSGEDSLEGLARKIQESLSMMPVFAIGELPPDFGT